MPLRRVAIGRMVFAARGGADHPARAASPAGRASPVLRAGRGVAACMLTLIGLASAPTIVANAAPVVRQPFAAVRPARPGLEISGRDLAHRRRSARAGSAPTVVVHEAVPAGLYEVRIAIASRTTKRNRVSVEIGSLVLHAVATRRSRAVVSVRIRIAHHGLTVRATGSRSRPRLRISVGRVAKLIAPPTAPSAPAPVPTPTPSPVAAPAPALAPAPPAPPPPNPVGVGGTWHLIFDDEFSSLNTSVWSNSHFGDGQIEPGYNSYEQECFDPAEVTVASGEADLNLVAKPETCGGVTQPYAGSILTTDGKWSFTYGYIEVRAWLPSNADGQVTDWPAIWAVGAPWPQGGELDLMEAGPLACAYWHGPTGDGASISPNGTDGCDYANVIGGWHTFAADWEPGIVTWYYDGQSLGCVSTSGSGTCARSIITGTPMSLRIDMATDPGSVYQAPATLRIDYVRVWQH